MDRADRGPGALERAERAASAEPGAPRFPPSPVRFSFLVGEGFLLPGKGFFSLSILERGVLSEKIKYHLFYQSSTNHLVPAVSMATAASQVVFWRIRRRVGGFEII